MNTMVYDPNVPVLDQPHAAAQLIDDLSESMRALITACHEVIDSFEAEEDLSFAINNLEECVSEAVEVLEPESAETED